MTQEASNDEPDENTTASSFAVNSRVEILFLLRELEQHDVLINLRIQRSSTSIITSILEVNEVSNTLIFDCAQDEALNRRLTAGDGADISACLEGVNIAFVTGRIEMCEFDDRPALRASIPKTLIRLQRREYFRIALPIVKPVVCTIPPAPESGAAPLTTHVMDMGCGGVSIIEEAGKASLSVGQVLPECRIVLPEVGTVTTTLEVRNIAQIPLRNGTSKTRYGCRFVNLPGAMSNLLQRYIMKLERERRNR